MNGTVDDYGRPLLRVTVVNPNSKARADYDAWVDTGFTGKLMLTTEQATFLDLQRSNGISTALADGSRAIFETCACQIEWFGNQREVEALISASRFALIGLGLLEDSALTINYPQRTVELRLAAE